jgi:hypothetical protein
MAAIQKQRRQAAADAAHWGVCARGVGWEQAQRLVRGWEGAAPRLPQGV